MFQINFDWKSVLKLFVSTVISAIITTALSFALHFLQSNPDAFGAITAFIVLVLNAIQTTFTDNQGSSHKF